MVIGKTGRIVALLLVVAALACPTPATAQGRSVLSLEAATHGGAVWRHTRLLTTQTGEWLGGQELGFRLQTRGSKAWHAWQRYPALGINVCYFQLGQGNHGHALGLLAHLEVPVLQRPHWTLHFRVGTGLARISNPYHFIKNPTQNAIGSPWNNHTQFRLGADIRLGPLWQLQTGAALNHYSNGGTVLPNFGVNLPTLYAGLIRPMQPYSPRDFLPSSVSRRAPHRIGVQAQAGLAVVEYSAPDGPKFAVWQGSIAGVWHFNQCNRALLSIDYENNPAIYAWGLNIVEFKNREEARLGAQRLGWSIGDEFVFGNIGILVQRGWYLGRDMNRLTLRRSYSKLSMRYYLPTLPHTGGTRIFLGTTLKAHFVVAEFIAWNMGVTF
jgi:hypothetical protein